MSGTVLAESVDSNKDQVMESSVKKPRNKFVIACAVLASMNSILLGYGMLYYLHILVKFYCFVQRTCLDFSTTKHFTKVIDMCR